MLFVVQFEDVNTDSLLDAVRGAGMSQRTRRPYLQRSVSRCSWNAAPCALRLCDWERGTNLERRRYESKIARSVVDEAPSRSCMCALTIDGRGAMCDVRCGAMEDGDVPFEFICEIARARALAEAGHVEGGAAAARHVDGGGVGEKGGVMAVGVLRVVVEVGGWVVVVVVRVWNGRRKDQDGSRGPERAVGLLQAQPLSEPLRALGRDRGRSSHVRNDPGYLSRV